MTAYELSQKTPEELKKINKVRCDYGIGTIDRITANERFSLVLNVGSQKVAVPEHMQIEVLEDDNV